jgi:demethylmenaquinone methyltransferase/2-methoxy-6-polyprenyl-1,4-benzoquinol methylase
VVGADFSEKMLELARAKAPGLAAASAPDAAGAVTGAGVQLRFEPANALELPYADDEFEAATVGFGARNFSDLGRGLAEMSRVVRPGGRVVVLEITTPTRPPFSTFLELWFDHLVPALGRFAGDADAYSYLPSSVRRFPAPEELAATMAACGLVSIRYLLTAGGIIALHVGEVAAR